LGGIIDLGFLSRRIVKRLNIHYCLIIILDPTGTATLRHIFSDAVYFLIKSGNEENISLAKAKVTFIYIYIFRII
jgi:hypothetical protein